MNNSKNWLEIDNINSQLERAEIQKSRLIRDIYKEYELYLNLVRDLLFISVEKGIEELYSYQLTKNDFLNANEFFCLFEKKICKLIRIYLPLLTVEQLKINKTEKNKNKDKETICDSLGSSIKIKNNQKENFEYKDGFNQFAEPAHFQISKDMFNTSKYYQAENNEKFTSIDLDKNDGRNCRSTSNIIENKGVEKQFMSFLLELIEEIKVENPIYSEIDNVNQIDISHKDRSLKIFNLIDKSLENLLLNLSYKINEQLFKANLIKKMISQDSFEYLVGKNLMIKHPHPFVINFEFNISPSSSKDYKASSIILFNLSTVELEFKSLNLSIQRNKINELKNQFQRLIKKETYWRQKEISLNRIR